MEKEKRKRAGEDGWMDGKKGKARDDVQVQTKTGNDDEVEEFYAILRRIQIAVKYFEKASDGEGDGRKLTAEKRSSLWIPAFEWEDFKKVGGVRSREGVEDNVGFDLNADPESDRDSV